MINIIIFNVISSLSFVAFFMQSTHATTNCIFDYYFKHVQTFETGLFNGPVETTTKKTPLIYIFYESSINMRARIFAFYITHKNQHMSRVMPKKKNSGLWYIYYIIYESSINMRAKIFLFVLLTKINMWAVVVCSRKKKKKRDV